MAINWHERFVQQSGWTKSIREYLFQNLEFHNNTSVLEIGCGTGAVLSDVATRYPVKGFGIDLDFDRTLFATRNYDYLMINTSDANALPFSADTFDLVFCHYFLLWLEAPEVSLKEVYRVLKPGGYFAVFAEPDYYHRVDAPSLLTMLGKLQNKSLKAQGAHPGAGREIVGMISKSGFQLLKFGVQGYEHPEPGIPPWWESEWQVLNHDLAVKFSTDELHQFQELDRKHWLIGDRVLYIPTYYTLCRKRK